ncbi:MAG: hypothetical protein HZB61_12910 [Nitrospirae bacterium]|nr:hypothetical protein [Nitrospirota bacterium]
MARIKIKDLPKDMKLSKEELKGVKGGVIIKTPNIQQICQSVASSVVKSMSDEQIKTVTTALTK